MELEEIGAFSERRRISERRNIKNIGNLKLKKLARRGHLDFLTKDQLKVCLQTRNLKSSGTKSEQIKELKKYLRTIIINI